MKSFTYAAALVGLVLLAGCEERRGVGLGPVGYGGAAGGPQPVTTTFEMTGLEPLPLYRYRTAEVSDANPAAAITAGGSSLRTRDTNLEVVVEGRTYLMRQIELNGVNYVVAEGAAPLPSLPQVIRARTGCLVQTGPLRSGDAAVYTLDCS